MNSVTELRMECDGCKKALSDAKTDNNKLHLHIKNLLSQSEQYQRKIERLTQGERAMQEKVRSSMDCVQQTELANAKLAAENEELKNHQVNSMQRQSQLAAQSNSLKLQLAKTQQLNEELNNELLIHREQIETVMSSNEELQQYASKLRQELNKVQGESKKLGEEYRAEKEKNREKVKELVERNRKLVKELETFRLDNTKLKVT
eukprot:TRINITY_DN10954_c0_g1_i1.p1 TRINITY_DN10954_c0_g1~~TRINITY_DN10954_c0_g1_i1.p1  ORF type:complete len:204 (+),score=83.17 TRINITY_DN10954_c0_g1_i1:798-1409(+)